jgi:hypothetical protein
MNNAYSILVVDESRKAHYCYRHPLGHKYFITKCGMLLTTASATVSVVGTSMLNEHARPLCDRCEHEFEKERTCNE